MESYTREGADFLFFAFVNVLRFASLRNFAGSGWCQQPAFLLISHQPCCSAVVNSIDRHPRVIRKSS